MKKKKRAEVKTMKAKRWYYKGSDIIGAGRRKEERERDKEKG